MAQTKGTQITAQDATPPNVIAGNVAGGVVKRWVDVFEEIDNANGDSRILFKLPIDLVVDKVNFACDALSAGTVDVGLWKKNADGTYSAVDDDCFASAIAVTSAVTKTDVTYEAAAANIDKALQPLWQRANLSARPAYGDLYLGLIYDTGTGAAGTVLVEVFGS